VVFYSKFSESFFDFFFRGVLGYTQYTIGIFFQMEPI